ncbi:pyridoxal-5'-phosphate-dependent protein beta subunit [Pyrenochaeta sp. MPI-SDFR-AT-0127]|nr:pyridoxal-5'-phosphate-dependent protein beta subunit [Pyrenochaeta sp. MPI-SDFR-AT-0127]
MITDGADNQVTVDALADATANAKERISSHVLRTPTIRLPWLDAPGLEVWAKLECQQHSGSFKYRGAVNALMQIPSQRIITASAGNHALATALAGKRFQKEVHVVAPTSASDIKVQRLMNDANVTLLGEDLFEATKEALSIAAESKDDDDGGMYFLSPYADKDVVAGAGTAVMESFEDVGVFDHVFLPLGGGGLAAAIGAWCAQRTPCTRVHCTHPMIFGRQFASDQETGCSISAQLLKATTPTYSDGLAVQLVTQTPFARILDSTIHSVIQISETDTAAAIAEALRLQSILIEGSAATTIAGLRQSAQTHQLQGRVLLLLTGGNIPSSAVAKALVTNVHDPGMRQTLGLRHIVSSVERHGSVAWKQNAKSSAANHNVSTLELWTALASRLQTSVLELGAKFDQKQTLNRDLHLQADDWCPSTFRDIHHQLTLKCNEFSKSLEQHACVRLNLWSIEERYRVLLQLYAMLGSLLDRASSANDQAKRDWFFGAESQHASNCNYDRYGSTELRKIEQKLQNALQLGNRTPIELLLTSSGMAAYQVIQMYLLQKLGAHGTIVVPPYIYFEALEQLEAFSHPTLMYAPTFDADDIMETAERHDAQVVFIDPVANMVHLPATDIRHFARIVSNRASWSSRIVVMDGTMESGGMSVFDWFDGPHAPTVLYYESVSKYLQLGLDLQMGGFLVFPSHLDNRMRTIRRNSGTIMYSRNAFLLPPIDHALYQARMLRLTENAERFSELLGVALALTVEVRYPHLWREYGWRHGGGVVTVRFLQEGMNNKEGLEACIDLILRGAEAMGVPLTKGVSFGFSTTRVSSASSMAQGTDPFLRFSVGCDMAVEDLGDVVIQGVCDYQRAFASGLGTRQ